MAPEEHEAGINGAEAERDVRDMIAEEGASLFTRHARVLVYINTSALLVGAVWLGIYIQRFAEVERRQSEMEQRITRVANVELLNTQIVALTAEVNRLRDRLDRLLDDGLAVRKRVER